MVKLPIIKTQGHRINGFQSSISRSVSYKAVTEIEQVRTYSEREPSLCIKVKNKFETLA